jgi:hypothetical protein
VVNKFLVNNTFVLLGLILTINGAIGVQIYSMLLDRVERNKIFFKNYQDIKKELKDNLTCLIGLFFIVIILVLINIAWSSKPYLFTVITNFIFIYTLVFAAFLLWEMVCYYGLSIPPTTNKD